MKILVLNCGSSSLKYQVIDMSNDEVLAKGVYERIGKDGSVLTHKKGELKKVIEQKVNNHKEGINIVITQLLDKEYGVISNLDEIGAIGHRVVHGGEKFKDSVIITDEVIEGIKDNVKFAPLHNPAALLGIQACREALPGKKNVAVFDTAFHQTMPKEHYIYPIPYKYYSDYGIRKYGFHGTSHKYVAQRISELLNKKDLKIINCHIGQGASLCAIKDGKSLDTSMGLTPLGGIPMGSRCGDLDPSVVTYIMEKENLTPEQVNNILNKESGLLGMSEISVDNRDVWAEADNGNEKAKLCLDVYNYLIAQSIAKYAVTLNGVDVITFCAGVGENDAGVRQKVCEYLEFLGIKIDLEKNKTRGEEIELSVKDSKVKIWIVPTNEELMIAKDTLALI